MTVRYAQLTEDCAPSDVATWYHTATDGDRLVMTRGVPPAIWLLRRPQAHVYLRTEGQRGLTVTLADAQQRLARVQEWVADSGQHARRRATAR
jgi:hypothetical protein